MGFMGLYSFLLRHSIIYFALVHIAPRYINPVFLIKIIACRIYVNSVLNMLILWSQIAGCFQRATKWINDL